MGVVPYSVILYHSDLASVLNLMYVCLGYTVIRHPDFYQTGVAFIKY